MGRIPLFRSIQRWEVFEGNERAEMAWKVWATAAAYLPKVQRRQRIKPCQHDQRRGGLQVESSQAATNPIFSFLTTSSARTRESSAGGSCPHSP